MTDYKSEREQQWRVDLRKSIPAKDRTNLERVEMPMQDAMERRSNNLEVNLGLTVEMAVKESHRCLDCANPQCVMGCPVSVNIPKFIKKIEAQDFLGAASVIKETSTLPAICGRVCPQEKQCESQCFYVQKLKKPAVAIGYLERFAADYERESGKMSVPEVAAPNGIKVAAIGSGPASLAWAADMAKFGYDVTVYEALHEIGGVLKYGIPEFRLPKKIVDAEINNLTKMGVKFVANTIIGRTITLETLRERGFKAFFIAAGAGLPRFMNIPGENSNGIFSSNEYLTRVNLMHAADPEYDTPVLKGKNIIVVGGGNTAMDSVRTAKRLGAEHAMIVYRRSESEMPARLEEVHHAKQEGVEFMTLNNPVEYIADDKGRVKQAKIQKMELGEPDASGRRSPVPVEGSEYLVDCEGVVVAVGVSPNPIITSAVEGLDVDPKRRTIIVNPENNQSNIPDIFAGGDIVRGGATVILAMGDGRKAAAGAHEWLQSQSK
ncbi:MAG: NADPH-dependent glutamate synthase [Bacteroidales bacterium]|nr:NADPH-dependent glutamate synthase [Bacteroidales bacterium]